MKVFDWKDYNNLAENIFVGCKKEDPLYEAKLRCVISRAYYAAFCSTKDFLEDRNGRSLGTSHVSVINEARKLECPEGHFINCYLDKLRNIRRAVDYDLNFSGKIESEARFALQKSKEIIGKINNIR
ncbi:hypothetical protein [Acaryochloris marina]|uniref:hypothetical protein n=1 Tax=Acaryochloris marina TaxID=155978 RepID=UPI00059F64CD|nr:hypothetical protein [Acaryochloris marina]